MCLIERIMFDYFRNDKLNKTVIATVIFFIIATAAAHSQHLLQTMNLDFEEGVPGKMPAGWKVPSYAKDRGYDGMMTELKPASGKYCLELNFEGQAPSDSVYGSVMQSIDAFRFRGRKYIFRAAVRAEIASKFGSAHLWVSERLAKNQIGSLYYMEDQPIVSNEWAYYELKGEIDPYAQTINFGLLLFGAGKAWIDDAGFELLIEDSTGFAAPAVLSLKGAENLAAFSKLFGYASFFHPGIEAQKTDWLRFGLIGMEYIESAETNEETAQKLKDLFIPTVPSIDIWIGDKKEKLPGRMKKPDNAIDNVALAWVQQVAGLNREESGTGSHVVNVYETQRKAPGAVLQFLDATKVCGKKILIEAKAKANPVGPESNAQIWLRFDDENNDLIESVMMNHNPIRSNRWKNYSIEANVPKSARFLRLGLVLVGDGKAFFDDVRIFSIENGKKSELEVLNHDFETGREGELPKQWLLTAKSKEEGYEAIAAQKQGDDNLCLEISSELRSRIKLPAPGELFHGQLPGGISFSMPLSVYVDSVRTLPYPPHNFKQIPINKPKDFIVNPADRTSRLVTVMYFWNFLRHFSLIDLPEEKWDQMLLSGLKNAAVDKNEKELLRTMQIMAGRTNDGQLRIWHEGYSESYGLPLLWKWTDGSLYISKTDGEIKNLQAGDEVIEINGIATKEAIEREMKLIAGNSLRWKRLRALATIRAGEKDSPVDLKIRKADGSTRDITLMRKLRLGELAEHRPDRLALLNDSIAYIDITRTDDNTIYNVASELKNIKGIILDARGVSQAAEHLLSLFVFRQLTSIEWAIPVFTRPDREDISYRLLPSRITPSPKNLGARLVVLADERSIGYTEAILWLVKNYKIGQIVGSKSAGTGGDVIPIRLPGGFNYTMTGITGTTPTGRDVFTLEIDPDEEVKASEETIKSGSDPVLQRALEILEMN